ncbi:MAG: dienelactone hydrolase [Oleiphilaceae bacterium]|jgi:dienelactone hydrolase
MKKIIIMVLMSLSMMINANGKFQDYVLNGQSYEGYFVSAKADAPLVLLVHDWDGLTEYEVKRANMLAELGFSVFAADLFGKGIRPTAVTDKKQHTGELYKDRTKMRNLLNAALEKAKELGGNTTNAVAMGYCFGGAAVLEMARSGANMKGFATFHGGLTTPEGQDYSQVKGKLLVMHGTADTSVTMAHFADLAKQLETEKIDHEMVTYGGAPHAFTVFGSERYHEKADQQSWATFLSYTNDLTRN